MNNIKIFVAGHTGLVGSAIVRKLNSFGYHNLILAPHSELDLRNQDEVRKFFIREKPEWVILAAGTVGGILANSKFPASFIYDNLAIALNVIESAHVVGVQKLCYLGSACVYPADIISPINESDLMTGKLHPSNSAYAVSKIAGVELCKSYRKQFSDNFISVMPANLYGINDNFNYELSHVVPALLTKLHDAVQQHLPYVEVWGNGDQMRELLYVDDLAEAVIYLMQVYDGDVAINIGSGEELSVHDLVRIISSVVGYNGDVVFQPSKPSGVSRRLLNSQMVHSLGWRATTSFQTGIERVYQWALEEGVL